MIQVDEKERIQRAYYTAGQTRVSGD